MFREMPHISDYIKVKNSEMQELSKLISTFNKEPLEIRKTDIYRDHQQQLPNITNKRKGRKNKRKSRKNRK